MQNKKLGDKMMLLKSNLSTDRFSFENIKNKLCNKIFAIKLYQDGSSYSGFLDETNNEIINHAIYKDVEGRKFMGILPINFFISSI
jgi:hypothetical protein